MTRGEIHLGEGVQREPVCLALGFGGTSAGNEGQFGHICPQCGTSATVGGGGDFKVLCLMMQVLYQVDFLALLVAVPVPPLHPPSQSKPKLPPQNAKIMFWTVWILPRKGWSVSQGHHGSQDIGLTKGR